MNHWIFKTFRAWCAVVAQWFRQYDPDPGKLSVAKLKNIDRHTNQLLEKIGIRNRADLVRLGALEAFEQIQQIKQDAQPNLVLQLHGAITNQSIAQIPDKQVAYLLEEAAGSSKKIRI